MTTDAVDRRLLGVLQRAGYLYPNGEIDWGKIETLIDRRGKDFLAVCIRGLGQIGLAKLMAARDAMKSQFKHPKNRRPGQAILAGWEFVEAGEGFAKHPLAHPLEASKYATHQGLLERVRYEQVLGASQARRKKNSRIKNRAKLRIVQ